jgi:glycosyltransferase involved in cell wall biosynthesis
MIRPDARIAVVGLGTLRRSLPTNAVSLGRVDAKTLTAAYRAADVVFVPSLFEAFSRVVIEAWQQETAVVVSDGVALAPVVSSTGGAVVQYGDAAGAAHTLSEFLGDIDGTAAAGRAGRQLVEARFELDGLLDDVEELYGDLARRRTAESHYSLSLESG